MPRRPRPAEETSVVGGRRPVLELLRSGGPTERVMIAAELAPSSVVGEIRKRSESAGVPVRVVPKGEIDRLAPETNHQGVVAVVGAYRYTPLEALLGSSRALLFLDGVMDPHNLGSLLRSADGAGFGGVVVKSRRAVGVTPAVRRISAGAAEVVPVARVSNLSEALDRARTSGLWVLGLDEKAPDDLWSADLADPPVALVLGAEDRGISRAVRTHCDAFASIPSTGVLGSLNVAVAGAIAMFEVARRARRSNTV